MQYETVAALVAENMKTIFAYALHRVSHREEAEDLAGDIIAAILESAPTLRCEEAFFGWFWAVAANTVKKYYRRKQNRPTLPEPEEWTEEEDPAQILIRREETALLRRELSLLAGEYRECTVAYYFDHLSCRETAEKLGLSVEMVKYYLYKTRRILKEGMTMTRTFGEKSYKPATFHFHTIFEGSFNREYRSLFARRLPGNILYCAYYTPMTVGELSVELGVAAVYLEDEIALLKQYGLLTETGNGKVQTRLCIFTEESDREFYKAAEECFTGKMGEILGAVRNKLPEIRSLGFGGRGLEENRLLWAFFFGLIREGYCRWKEACEIAYPTKLYDNANGVNYAEDYDEPELSYTANAFAGYYGLNPSTAACFADFGVLGDRNALGSGHNWARIPELARESRKGEENGPLVYLTLPQTERIYQEILTDEVTAVGTLYGELTELAARILQSHAPASVAGEIPAVVQNTVFHRTVGLMGKLAVDSGELHLPADDLPAAVYLFETEDVPEGMKGDVSD